MKKTVLALVLAGMATASMSSAFAADSVDLKVTGTLVVGACTPTIDNDAVVDYGDVSVADLSATAANALGAQSTNLNIDCESAMKVGFTTADDRSDSEKVDTSMGNTATTTFGLGFTDASNATMIGGYNVAIGAPTYDSKTGSILTSTDSGSTWSASTSATMVNAGTQIYTVGNALGTPVAFSSAVFPLTVNASTQDTTTLNLADDTPLDGQATITLKYL
ncbi:DUF1120 domain-containing protein [Kluyvera sichuanensis]|uniref:DUF1120 domain-containing protein n=1 Tax=Kluyvera sichuanensis TaxID=2725494 RepID=UPI002FD0E308